MKELPTEAELKKRISMHQSWARDKYAAALIWKGYVAGLFEWGLIDVDAYYRLDDLLGVGGEVELSEVFGGEPLNDEQRKEVEAYARKRSQQRGSFSD